MARPDPATYGSAYAACGLLFLLAPPAGLLMLAVLSANLADEWLTERHAEKSAKQFRQMLELSDSFGWGPIMRYGEDRYGTGGPASLQTLTEEMRAGYQCSCHKLMGNDFYFLPRGECLYKPRECDARRK